ncbi:hypothetical protein [Formosa haliotis]|uniref:hypothetical protein n=1 Tax=Formosa haliotis TaxID=1555194 RepID=UPI00135659E9|nr:hypothetical protein [Formosa haliotis]
MTETIYMSYVVPAYFVYAGIILFGLKKYNLKKKDINFKGFEYYGVYILIIGVFCDFLKSYMPGSLQFFFFLVANFKFVGGLILLFSDQKWHRYLFYGVIVYLFLSALRSGMFHDFLLWTTFYYMFWAYKYKTKIKMNIIVLLAGFILSTAIQAVKHNYRMIIQQGYSGNNTELFLSILSQRISGGDLENEEEQGQLNVRLNQGWIISAIMNNVPGNEPFAEGETVKDAISASALPRFLNPNKKQAGGVENFLRFTGLTLGENTSMGLSIIGEAYANFGVVGGIFFMGIWSWSLIGFWNYFLRQVNVNTILIFFIPLLFLQVVKAETELVVVLNHLVKSLVVIFLFIWAGKKFLNWNFERQS